MGGGEEEGDSEPENVMKRVVWGGWKGPGSGEKGRPQPSGFPCGAVGNDSLGCGPGGC